LIILDDTGHMAPLERHGQVSRALAELASNLAGRPDKVSA